MPNIEKMAKKVTVVGGSTPLDRHRADEILEPDADLWGLKMIGRCLGVSEDTARRWAVDSAIGLPVSRRGGRWFARKRALLVWLRGR